MDGQARDTRDPFDTGVRLEALDPERPLPVQTPWGEFALFRIGDEVLCVQSFCPHLAGPLFQGTISGDCITCPWHLWRFSLRTGARLDGDGANLRRCAVQLGVMGEIRLTPLD